MSEKSLWTVKVAEFSVFVIVQEAVPLAASATARQSSVSV